MDIVGTDGSWIGAAAGEESSEGQGEGGSASVEVPRGRPGVGQEAEEADAVEEVADEHNEDVGNRHEGVLCVAASLQAGADVLRSSDTTDGHHPVFHYLPNVRRNETVAPCNGRPPKSGILAKQEDSDEQCSA